MASLLRGEIPAGLVEAKQNSFISLEEYIRRIAGRRDVPQLASEKKLVMDIEAYSRYAENWSLYEGRNLEEQEKRSDYYFAESIKRLQNIIQAAALDPTGNKMVKRALFLHRSKQFLCDFLKNNGLASSAVEVRYHKDYGHVLAVTADKTFYDKENVSNNMPQRKEPRLLLPMHEYAEDNGDLGLGLAGPVLHDPDQCIKQRFEEMHCHLHSVQDSSAEEGSSIGDDIANFVEYIFTMANLNRKLCEFAPQLVAANCMARRPAPVPTQVTTSISDENAKFFAVSKRCHQYCFSTYNKNKINRASFFQQTEFHHIFTELKTEFNTFSSVNNFTYNKCAE